MQSLFLTFVFASLMFLGFSAAFAAALGFVWIDIVKPQQLAFSIINNSPLSLMAAMTTMGLFLLKDRKFAPKFGVIMVLMALFTIWITFTTAMSDYQAQAWPKWDWASRVLIFALIFPFIFRSRVQIEAFILVLLFSASTIFFSAGIKTLFGGGGYGLLAIMGAGNTGLAEGSTLAVVCVMLIPLIAFIMRRTLLLPKTMLTNAFFVVLIVVALSAVVGTAARTGVIAVCVLCGISMLQSKKKGLWIAGMAIAGIILINLDLSATPWGARMSTIETYNADSSALGRLVVWKWTVEFIGSHPLGGGFNAYLHNRIAGVTLDGMIERLPEGIIGGKAFHSIYFEILGEQGIPGFIMYFSIILLTFLKLLKLNRKWRKDADMEWFADLANALMMSTLIFLAGGAFVGIAYQPFIFYIVSLTVSLDQYAVRYEKTNFNEKVRVKA